MYLSINIDAVFEVEPHDAEAVVECIKEVMERLQQSGGRRINSYEFTSTDPAADWRGWHKDAVKTIEFEFPFKVDVS